MRQLSDEEINNIWNTGMTFKELVQAAYEHGYNEHNERVLGHDKEWLETQKKRNR